MVEDSLMLPPDAGKGKGSGAATRASQFSSVRSTGILPVAEKHGQDARALPTPLPNLNN